MAKRPRRKVVVLESDDDEDEEKDDGRLPAPHNRVLHLANVPQQSGEKSETNPKRKLQKLSQQSTMNSLFEARGKITGKKVSHGTFPLEVTTLPAASTEHSSKRRKTKTSAKTRDHQKPVLERSVDHRLWVDKYAPQSGGELVVHSKKVAEVKKWLQVQLLNPYGSHLGSRVLILTGPAGVGKTAVVHVLADLLEIELCEWTTPAPELWQEYSHHAASGGPYVSKLDEFEAFLERGRKMSSLPIVSGAISQKVRPFSGADRKRKGAKVLLIDDLPVAGNRDHHQRLTRNLYHLAVSQNFPAIVVITDETGTGDRLCERDFEHKDVIEALERGGAKKIVFNPVTVNAMKKLLYKVQLLENCRLSSESMYAVAESSSGDIRQALTSLQFLCLSCNSHNLNHLMWDPGGLGSSQSDPRNRQANETNSQETTIQSNKSYAGVGGGRDYSLSLFHALGKFLHNKRLTDEPVHSGKDNALRLKEEFWRHPLNMEEPEVVISQAHADTATLLAFLHENVLQFIDEDATDDVAIISAYLSDTDCLLGTQGIFRSRHALITPNDVDPSQVATAVANSVAARGVLFGNGHPAPRRWQSLRAPALWQAERQKRLRKVEMSTQGMNGIFEVRTLSGFVQATELYPFSQQLSRHFPPSSSAKILTAPKIVKIDDSLEIDEYKNVDSRDLQHQDEMGPKQEHFQFETTFRQMCVEDDIEDPDG